ncbi:MAG: GDSL-like Lipase/Acylhydrolase family [Paenibacillus sp.]|uniref:SGNH/GDSL hydrolase family protein n=1 Tax=Paenibacillus sp. GYB004 TaxID=2994393 RepID=UPI0029E9FBFC|nr:GDSL-like Lipase/Acylhydrolase family [Paenibacillus sp.]
MKLANVNIDAAESLIVFIGDSHTVGQGATDTGDDRVRGLPAPPGVTDRFHQRDPSSGVWVDQFARHMRSKTGIGMHQFVNAGRGNHTIRDYLGEPVTIGAGGVGDKDHTDHLAEVLELNPTLIILQPMIINDWFHGMPLPDTKSAFTRMIGRIQSAQVGLVVIGPAPIITLSAPFDYADNDEYAAKPPFKDDLWGYGRYSDYYDVIRSVCAERDISFIHTYEYFLYRYKREDHRNWTIGESAGRIHVNQHGHDLYLEALLQALDSTNG